MLRADGNCVSSTPGVSVPLFKLPPSGSKPGNLVKLNKSRPKNATDVMRKQPGRGDKKEVASTTYQIVHGKNIKERGFKTKELAVYKATEMMG